MRSVLLAAVLLLTRLPAIAQRSYLGFDRNNYPGDERLSTLHRDFAWTGYWLNNPPGMTNNPWSGKRGLIRSTGFGFALLFNGRLDAQLRNQDSAALGRNDAAAAIAAAKGEGFPAGAVIFLDQEEGGALLPEQAAYMDAWIGALSHSDYKAGIYCSGIPVSAGSTMVSTAQDIQRRFPDAELWVWDDRCPPSPGCVADNTPNPVFNPSRSGFSAAMIWQYAQSPRRPEDTAACENTYAADRGCYAPHLARSPETWIDLNVSSSADPSRGR